MIDRRFQQLRDQYMWLQSQFAARQMSREQYLAAVQQLMVQDAQGRHWMIHPDTGRWIFYDGAAWVEAQPAGGVYGEPTPQYVQSPQRRGLGVVALVGLVGTIVGMLLMGAIAALLFINQSPKTSPSASVTEPTVSSTLVSKIISLPTAMVIVVTATPVPTAIAPTPAPVVTLPTATSNPIAAPSPTAAAASLVAQADDAAFKTKFDDAAALYQRAVERDPTNALAYARWARLLEYQGHLEMRETLLFQAMNKSQSASQLAPNDPEVLTWMARAYAWSEIYDKALGFAQRATLLGPTSAEAFAVLAEVELATGAVADAERDAFKAVEINPNSGEAHRTTGLVLNAKQQYLSAVPELERAAQLEPNLAVRQMELGVVYRGAGNLALAAASLERAVAMYPRAARAYGALGAVYRDQKSYDKSIQSLNTSIQINDQAADLYAELGQTYLAAGQLSAAADAAQKGAALESNNPNIRSLQAAISQAQGTPVAGAGVAIASAPPGVYVVGMQTDPPEVKHGQMPTFQVTFLNTLGVNSDYTWFVKIYEPEKKNSFGETAKSAGSIPPGTTPFSTFSNWKASGTSPCRQWIARAFYINEKNEVVEFPKPGGDTFWYYFSVCQ